MGNAVSFALDSQNIAHIAHRDLTNDTLTYTSWNSSSSSWLSETVDQYSRVGWVISLALDSQQRPHVAYYDRVALAPQNLKYATFDGTSWTIETLDSQGSEGENVSLCLDSQDRPHVAYYYRNSDHTDGHLKYAVRHGTTWDFEVVDDAGSVGLYASLALDQQENPHIAYFDWSNDSLKYAVQNGGIWNVQVVDGQSAGKFASLALDSHNQPRIAYFDISALISRTLKYAEWSATGMAWNIQTITPAGTEGQWASLSLDSQDRPHIAYYDRTHDNLKYATRP